MFILYLVDEWVVKLAFFLSFLLTTSRCVVLRHPDENRDPCIVTLSFPRTRESRVAIHTLDPVVRRDDVLLLWSKEKVK